MAITYKDSGVDIDAGEETVSRIKPLVRSTFRKEVMTDIGLFGGFFEAKFPDYAEPVLVASTDGVGTKLKVAIMADKHDTVGQCLVNHCVNDILACGARPLFFLDYFATGKLIPDVAVNVISGFAKACKENNCSLIGGETAEMPSIYQDGDYDMSGTIVGVVDKQKIVDGKQIKKGDVMLGFISNGLHTNGYSLARKVLFPKFKHDEFLEELGETVAESLLKVHKSYLPVIDKALASGLLKGISHITGGGIVGNTSRIVRGDLKMEINWSAWERPAIFNLIQREGEVPEEDMRRAFNLGVGLIIIVDKNDVEKVSELCLEKPFVLGEIA